MDYGYKDIQIEQPERTDQKKRIRAFSEKIKAQKEKEEAKNGK